jgi:hypothetical protein
MSQKLTTNNASEPIVVRYSDTGERKGVLIIILRDKQSALKAMNDLQGAPLFDSRIEVARFELPSLPRELRLQNMDFVFGWYGTKSPMVSDVMFRYPPMTPPKDGEL